VTVFRISIVVLAAAVFLPAGLRAENASSQPAENGEYFFGSDETRLRSDIVDIRSYYARPDEFLVALDDPGEEFVYFGAGYAGGPGGMWAPAAAAFQGPGGSDIAADRPHSVALWIDWRPDVTSTNFGADTRQIGRSLTGSEIERIGLRADVTALLFDHSGSGTTAWHVTGALGSTSLSLVGESPAMAGASDSGGGLLWDVGVGWSSGGVSLNAGYQSASRLVEDGGDIAVLSLGADYTILPGLSVYGELNLIDDPALTGPERMGTVFILGTGLNF